jgi:dienelactone hydrolase
LTQRQAIYSQDKSAMRSLSVRHKLSVLSVCVTLLTQAAVAQIPATDSRNRVTPNTDTHFVMPPYANLQAWSARRSELRQQILSAAGLSPMPPKTPLHPEVFGRLERNGYTIEKVLLESMPHYYLGGNLYRPVKAGKHPGVLITHGHWEYGRLENQPLNSTPTEGANLARQGYVAFAIDMVGYNDTLQTPHEFGGPREDLWSFSPLGLQLWNSTRALDFLLSLNDVDPTRIGVTGASGGGSQTFLLSAIDDRVTVSAPVNMVSGYMQGGARCENASGLRVGTSNLEIAALMAPKPMLLVSSTGDWTSHVPDEEFPAIRQIYALYDKAANLENFHQDAPHNYNRKAREAVYRFFAKHLLQDPKYSEYVEQGVPIERLQDMLALMNRPLPQGALTYEELFKAWQAMSKAQFEESDVASLRLRLQQSLGVVWPADVLHEDLTGGDLLLGRPGEGDRIPAKLLPGQGSPVLVVDPNGIEAGLKSSAVAHLQREGRQVFLIDAFQTGSAVAARDRSATHFLGFNRSDDANRIQDIVTAVAFLHGRAGSQNNTIELVGIGPASVWCLFAAAVTPVPVKIDGTFGAFQGSDDEFLTLFSVPGIQRQGGLAAALRLTSREASAAN